MRQEVVQWSVVVICPAAVVGWLDIGGSVRQLPEFHMGNLHFVKY